MTSRPRHDTMTRLGHSALPRIVSTVAAANCCRLLPVYHSPLAFVKGLFFTPRFSAFLGLSRSNTVVFSLVFHEINNFLHPFRGVINDQ